uniref:RING-type domain-containing protein n=1 Tax=Globodera rostochiensis TaxID=31243 RepID=A0A914IH74_GLORO
MAPPSSAGWKQLLEARIAALEEQLRRTTNRTTNQHTMLRAINDVTLQNTQRLERVEAWASREVHMPYQPRFAPYISARKFRRERSRQQPREVPSSAAVSCTCATCVRTHRQGQEFAVALSEQEEQLRQDVEYMQTANSNNNNNIGNRECRCTICTRGDQSSEVQGTSASSNVQPGLEQHHQQQQQQQAPAAAPIAAFSLNPEYDPCGCHDSDCTECATARRINRVRNRNGIEHGPVSEREGLEARRLREAGAFLTAPSTYHAVIENGVGVLISPPDVPPTAAPQNPDDNAEPAVLEPIDPWASIPFKLFWERECVVCLSSVPRTYGPCGHVALCVACSVQMVVQSRAGHPARCPICRRRSGHFKILGNYPEL